MAKLICPLCGASTSFEPLQLEGEGLVVDRHHILPTDNRLEPFRRRVALKALTDQTYMQVQDTCYAILVCQACGKWFVAKSAKYEEEWSAVYPIPHRPVAEEIPEPIKSEFEEARLCFAVGAHRGCLLVCRTALIALQREQGVSTLQELKDRGTISDLLYRQSNQVRLWANMMGHEDVPEAITKDDCEQLLTYLEALLDAVYVQLKRLSGLTQKLGQLKKDTKQKPSNT